LSDYLRDNRRVLIYIVMSNLVLFVSFQVWQTLFNNYAVEEIGVGPAGIGLIQALREIPGLLGFLSAFLAMVFSEVRIMAVSILLLGVGMIFTGQAQGMSMLMGATLVMSFGFHFFQPSASSVVLMLVKKADTPKILGLLGSLGALAAIVGTGVVYFLEKPLGYRALFIGFGAIAIVAGLVLLPFKAAATGLPATRRFVLRKRYWLYYSLSLLMGCRRHIFSTFAIYLLVQQYHINVQTTALLFLANSLVGVFTARWAGKVVAQIGERRSLSITFAALVLVFLGYAYVTYLPALYALFITDSVLFGFGLALTTYFQKIAVSPTEITSNVSVEQTTNHIAAVIIPLVGGIVWATYGSQAAFLVGVAIVALSLGLTQFMRIEPSGALAASLEIPA